MPRLLAVLPDHPHPLDMGNRIRNTRILESLAREFDLTIVSQVHNPEHLAKPGRMAELGEWVPVFAPHRRDFPSKVYWHLRGAWSGWRDGIWRETFFQSLPALSREAERQFARVRPDVVHVAYWYTLRRWRDRPRSALWVVDTHDVQFERHAQLFDRTSLKERAAEVAELDRYDRVVAITEEDRQSFARVLTDPARLEVIPMGLDLEHWCGDRVEPLLPEGPRVLFYGNLGTSVNQEAALHLLRDLVPPLKSRVPGLSILLSGADPSGALRESAAATGVPFDLPGFVPDVRPWLRSARVFALSLRKGSGQRGRVLEVLAMGVPVVAYPEAIRGLWLEDGDGIRLVDSTEQFVAETARLLSDREAAGQLAARGLEALRARYSWEATYGRFPRRYLEWLALRSEDSVERPS